MVRMRGFHDFIVTEGIPHPANQTMLAGLPEKWRLALKRAVQGEYLDAEEKAGGAWGGNLWEQIDGHL